jgi:hypothetical protein
MAFNEQQLVTLWRSPDGSTNPPARVTEVHGSNRYSIRLDDGSTVNDVDGSYLHPRKAREGEEAPELYEVDALHGISIGRNALPLQEAEQRARELSEGNAGRHVVYEVRSIDRPYAERVVSRWVRGVKCEPGHLPRVEVYDATVNPEPVALIPVTGEGGEAWALNAAFKYSAGGPGQHTHILVAADGTRADRTSG